MLLQNDMLYWDYSACVLYRDQPSYCRIILASYLHAHAKGEHYCHAIFEVWFSLHIHRLMSRRCQAEGSGVSWTTVRLSTLPRFKGTGCNTYETMRHVIQFCIDLLRFKHTDPEHQIPMHALAIQTPNSTVFHRIGNKIHSGSQGLAAAGVLLIRWMTKNGQPGLAQVIQLTPVAHQQLHWLA